MKHRVAKVWTATIVAILGVAGAAVAQGYPNRPIKYIVPTSAGSGPDLVARLVAQPMAAALGQPVVVENKPGAEGVIAAVEVAKSVPDGYTLLGTNSTIVAANSAMKKQLPYDPVRDFAPIARFVTAALVLVVKPEFPVRTLREFLAHAKARPGALTVGYGTGGAQVSVALLKSLAGVKVLEVAYKGNPQAVNDLLGGSVAFVFSDYPIGFTQIRAGKLKALGVTSRERTSLAPDLPALAEELPGFDVTIWSGLAAPAGTPREIIGKLFEAAKQAITRPEVKARLAALSVDVAPLNPAELAEFSRSEIAKWVRQVKEAGIQPE